MKTTYDVDVSAVGWSWYPPYCNDTEDCCGGGGSGRCEIGLVLMLTLPVLLDILEVYSDEGLTLILLELPIAVC